MKLLYLISLILILFSTKQKNNPIGEYENHFGSEININKDSTYNYSWHFDLSYSWIDGKWEIHGDTILLSPILVYDTLSFYDSLSSSVTDSLILSRDRKPSRITMKKIESDMSLSDCQNCFGSPRKLFFEDGKLYDINNKGEIRKAKRKGIIGNKKYPPYFFNKE